MTVKLSGQHYVTCSFIIPCLKSLQVAMEALCLGYEESDFKKQIASALKRSVIFFIEELIDSTLTPLNQEFKEYENINIDFDTDVLEFWCQCEKNFFY
jgi:hypothetical protein